MNRIQVPQKCQHKNKVSAVPKEENLQKQQRQQRPQNQNSDVKEQERERESARANKRTCVCANSNWLRRAMTPTLASTATDVYTTCGAAYSQVARKTAKQQAATTTATTTATTMTARCLYISFCFCLFFL